MRRGPETTNPVRTTASVSLPANMALLGFHGAPAIAIGLLPLLIIIARPSWQKQPATEAMINAPFPPGREPTQSAFFRRRHRKPPPQ